VVIRRSIYLIVTALVLLGTCPVLNAQITVTAYVDRTEISEGESVQFTIEIKGDASGVPGLDLQELPDWQIYSSGTSSNFAWINGHTEQSKQYNFTMVPKRTGRLVIPSFTLPVGGKQYPTPQLSVVVNPVSMPPTQSRNVPPTRSRQPARSMQPQRFSEGDLLLRSFVDRDTVYVNQQVTLTTRFYFRVQLLNNPDYRAAQRTGFWIEDLGQWRTGTETYGGKDFNTMETKTALFPTAPGTQTIGSSEMTVMIDDGSRSDPFSVFDRSWPNLFGGGRRIVLNSDPIKIVTLPLPEAGKPGDFGGAVGQYQMTTSLDKNKIEVNEPATMHIKITGTGNIKSVGIPKVSELPDFRTYQAGDNEKVEKVNYQVGGTKTFDQVFIAKRAGSYLLPGLKFSFFDPQARTYKTVTADPIQVEVVPSKDRYASQVQNLQTNRIDLTAKDIRYLKPNLGELRSRRAVPISASPFFVIFLYLIPVFGYVVVLTRQRHKERLQSDVGFRRLRQAKKMAENRLAKAKGLLEGGDADAFYAEINHSLIDYFADRYNLPGFGLTSEKIKDFAAGKQSDNLVAHLLDLLQQSDFGRFAPGGSEKVQMTRLWEETKMLIVELEKTR
jgi:hypothetical protein